MNRTVSNLTDALARACSEGIPVAGSESQAECFAKIPASVLTAQRMRCQMRAFDPSIENSDKGIQSGNRLVAVNGLADPEDGKENGAFRLFHDNPLPMWIFDVQSLRFLATNLAASRVYGFSPEEFRSMTLRDIRLPADAPLMEQQVRSGNPSYGRIWTHVTKSGEKILVRISSNHVNYGGCSARFVVAEDVTDSEMLQAELIHRVHHDPLTELPNRSLIEMLLRSEVRKVANDSEITAFLCLELERFKQLKENHGRSTADEVLLHVASMLRRASGPHDCICRSGEQEFSVLLRKCQSVEEAQGRAEAFHQAVSSPVTIANLRLQLTCSGGLALYPNHGSSVAEIWRVADAAIHDARRSGGRRLVMSSPAIRGESAERIVIEHYLRNVLQRGGLQLHYQPQYRMDGSIHGFEALLRLPHPTGGYIAPDRFIGIAEEGGMIDALGEWALKEACRQAKIWNSRRELGFRIAVNVSPMQLVRPDFAQTALRTMREVGIDPSWIEMEVTEQIVVSFEESATQMQELANAGVRFAIDDFGTGYSSLQHIDRLPVTVVKIDRSFVRRLSDARSSEAIVEAIVRMGHSLGMQVIAEGVETNEQLELVKDKGCDIVQGFLFSRALPADEAGTLIDSA